MAKRIHQLVASLPAEIMQQLDELIQTNGGHPLYGSTWAHAVMLLNDALLSRDEKIENLKAHIGAGIVKAVAEEREACALICDSVNNFDNPMTARDCADAIRARGVVKEPSPSDVFWCAVGGCAEQCSNCAEEIGNTPQPRRIKFKAAA